MKVTSRIVLLLLDHNISFVQINEVNLNHIFANISSKYAASCEILKKLWSYLEISNSCDWQNFNFRPFSNTLVELLMPKSNREIQAHAFTILPIFLCSELINLFLVIWIFFVNLLMQSSLLVKALFKEWAMLHICKYCNIVAIFSQQMLEIS